MVTKFEDDYFFLSNFYMSKIRYKGITYTNAEAAFQAQKTQDEDYKKTKFANATPTEARMVGYKMIAVSNWDSIKDKAMYQVCYNKFTQNKDILKKLLKTDGKLIFENELHDNYWGVCTCNKCRMKPKRNKLGKALMDIRDQIKSGRL